MYTATAIVAEFTSSIASADYHREIHKKRSLKLRHIIAGHDWLIEPNEQSIHSFIVQRIIIVEYHQSMAEFSHLSLGDSWHQVLCRRQRWLGTLVGSSVCWCHRRLLVTQLNRLVLWAVKWFLHWDGWQAAMWSHAAHSAAESRSGPCVRRLLPGVVASDSVPATKDWATAGVDRATCWLWCLAVSEVNQMTTAADSTHQLVLSSRVRTQHPTVQNLSHFSRLNCLNGATFSKLLKNISHLWTIFDTISGKTLTRHNFALLIKSWRNNNVLSCYYCVIRAWCFAKY